MVSWACDHGYERLYVVLCYVLAFTFACDETARLQFHYTALYMCGWYAMIMNRSHFEC